MARYETPSDPRHSDLRPRRERHQRSDRRDYVPLIGLFFGAIVTIGALYLAWSLATTLLHTDSLAIAPLEPELIVLTPPPGLAATATIALATPTPLATLTPEPTPDPAFAPDTVRVGYYARVANTNQTGLSVRGGPSTDNVKLVTAPEGSVVLIIGGPSEGSGFTWWQARMADGTEGWMAAQFLEPSDAP
jgi:hypothetical protein